MFLLIIYISHSAIPPPPVHCQLQRFVDKLADFRRISCNVASSIKGWSTIQTAEAKQSVKDGIPHLCDEVLVSVPMLHDFATKIKDLALKENQDRLTLKRKLEAYEKEDF